MQRRRKNAVGIRRHVVFFVFAVALCAAAPVWFVAAAMETPRQEEKCRDRFGEYARNDPRYAKCIDSNAEKFLRADFAESKDLAKAFLTLLVAVFVGSITFSEKIVKLHNARRPARAATMSAWSFFLLAIIACGCGLAFIALAGGMATHYPNLNYWRHEQRAIIMWGVSGLAFGAGLVALLVAGILSLGTDVEAEGGDDEPGRRDPRDSIIEVLLRQVSQSGGARDEGSGRK